jgi:hypothetical protein
MYKPLKDYVWANELMRKAGYSVNAYKYWANVDKLLKVGSLTFIKKEDLPNNKYTEALKQCTNLDGYYPASAFMKLMGVSGSFIATLDRRPREGAEPLKSIYLNSGIRFIKIPEEVEESLLKGNDVRILTSLDAGYYKRVMCSNGIIFGELK